MDIIVDALEVDETAHADDIEHLKDMASEAPIIKVVNFIFNKAIESGASDVHIEPFEEKLQIRLRIDGVLNDIDSPPVTSSSAVISRIKIMAKLDIARQRKRAV
jgi:general secretion pathway protein E